MSNKATVQFSKDDWLSETMAMNVFKLNITSPLSSIPSQPVGGFYFIKTAADDTSSIELMKSSGFNVIETNVTLERIAEKITFDFAPDSTIEESTPDTAEKVLDIAENSFTHSRFHMDPDISNTLANTVKREWIRSYIDKKRGSGLLVIKHKKKTAGFLAWMKTNENDRDIAVIDLIAISNEFQGLGLGKQLVNHFINTTSNNHDAIRVGTQESNKKSLALYEKLGFGIIRKQKTLHAHK